MSLFPYNTNVTRQAQTDAPAIKTTLLAPVSYALGSPATADDDFLVAAATAMKVGAYTLLNTVLDVARNLTLTHTATSTADTLGTVDVVGTDIAGNALTETITPVSGTVVQGTKAFKTITSITGVGWVVNTGADVIKVGFGDKLGLPDKLSRNTVHAAYLDGVRETTAATVVFSSSVLAGNMVDLNSACNGTAVIVDYLV